MKRWWVLSLTALVACTPMPEPEPEPEEEPYDGETVNNVIPGRDPDDLDVDAGDVIVDAGNVVVDTTCCETHFSITDEEPGDATGVLVGELAVFTPGVPLTRTDAGWSATACVPVNAGARYSYRFTWDAGTIDAGFEEFEDGGMVWREEIVIVTADRASGGEPQVSDAVSTTNYYRSVSTCDEHDGGVPP